MKKFKYLKATIATLFELSPVQKNIVPVLSFFKAVGPFVNYVFSALIINLLFEGRTWDILAYYIIAAVLANALVFGIVGVMEHFYSIHDLKCSLKFDQKIAFTLSDMNYQQLESRAIQALIQAIHQAGLRIGGTEQIFKKITIISQSFLGVLLAAVSLAHVYQTSNINGVTLGISVLVLAFLLMLISVATIALMRLQAKVNDKTVQINQQITEANSSAFYFMQMMADYRFGKDIRIYNLKNIIGDAFTGLWKSSVGIKLIKELGKQQAKVPVLIMSINSIIGVVAYLFAAVMAFRGVLSVGYIILYAGSIQTFISAISALIQNIGELTNDCAMLSPQLEVISQAAANQTDCKQQFMPINGPCSLEFRNVSFRYPGSNQWALQNVSFTINDTQHVAIVGKNGSGKSTIVKLLCRFYDPCEGEILINKRNILEYDKQDLWAYFTAVFQDFKLFSFSIAENIAASEDINVPQVLDALTKVGLINWTNRLKNGVHTILYNNYEQEGIELSGGEAQKIAIARAIYKQANCFILDEPTSALDPRAENDIYRNFNSLVDGKTAIYISHRLASCKFCDLILVLDQGSIVQSGSHDELVSDDQGLYYELWHAQAQFYQT